MKTVENPRDTSASIQRSHSWILRNLILPAGDLTFGHKMMSRLRFLEKAQWWNPPRLDELRKSALQSLIRTAYQEVPFYSDLMQKSRVRPEDVVTPEDLRKIPIVTKKMLRSAYPHLTTRVTGGKVYESCSSGSTGENFCVKEDAETAGWYRASFLLALQWTGWRIGESHVQTGMTLHRSIDKRLKDRVLRCNYVSAYDLSDSKLDQTLEILERKRISHLWGYPGSLYYLAQRARKKGWNRSLRSIVTWGDNLYSRYRREIEAAFGTRVYDTYGCGEGIHIAAQCGAQNTYHTHDLDVIVECVDDDGRAVPPGETGHLLLTRLHPGPMPLIRYQVGDLGIMGDKLCECGRGYGVMHSIEGRDTDVVITPQGNRLIVHFFTGVLEHFSEIETFQVSQQKVDSITLRVVPTKNFGESTARRIVAKLQERGAGDLRIDIELVDHLPLAPSGKRRFVISDMGKPKFDERSSSTSNGSGNGSKYDPSSTGSESDLRAHITQ